MTVWYLRVVNCKSDGFGRMKDDGGLEEVEGDYGWMKSGDVVHMHSAYFVPRRRHGSNGLSSARNSALIMFTMKP